MSVHIEAEKGAIAETVLLPGDPLRAQWIANTFLDDVVCYNQVRGMLGFTGYYKGKRISVQASGMGVPSALIYYHELINDYSVKNLIRVGTAGSYQKHVKLKDVIIAMAASSTSAINSSKFGHYTYAPTASYNLFEKAVDYAKSKNIPIHAGNVLTADVFYDDNPEFYKTWADYGVLCVEMETAGLYSIAAKHKVNALSILTISDSLVSEETTSTKDRESTFDNMVNIALNIV
ncbi:purine-nucleoside phosphorylase [Aestuariibaculum suncheonense]|uniref:Uridine phosphorylase n=1 Tax=Aestuariibaculum suncheonense TaxID=1028745 RepID=A0A8J6UCJ1_9FLAO|nr:purine-nucleoside phosphorylase [Aestuariibaculum suncheonense]MBD0836342.1 purine-nucleoside phosphorylase [Aestuariibaculum suncheonense]